MSLVAEPHDSQGILKATCAVLFIKVPPCRRTPRFAGNTERKKVRGPKRRLKIRRRTPRFAGNTERQLQALQCARRGLVAEPHDSQGILKDDITVETTSGERVVAEPHDSQGILKALSS